MSLNVLQVRGSSSRDHHLLVFACTDRSSHGVIEYYKTCLRRARESDNHFLSFCFYLLLCSMSAHSTESEESSIENNDRSDEVLRAFVWPREFYFPEDTVLDLHDLVGILLHEYQQTEIRFRHSKLLEVADGTKFPSCLPTKELKPWAEMGGRKVGYFLLDPQEIPPRNTPLVEPNEFLHPSFVSPRLLDTEDVETIYWRVRLALANNTGGLLYALQCILRAFTASVTLRVRTSQGHSLICPAHAFKIKGSVIIYKEGLHIGHIKSYIDDSWLKPHRRIDVKHYQYNELHLDDEWLYMVFESEGSRENNVVLDLASLVIGSRGLGGEIFTLEKEETYQEKVLPKVVEICDDSDEEDHTYDRIDPPPAMDDSLIAQDTLVINRVLRRLNRICQGVEVFCAYCGRPQAPSRCSKCAVARYCGKACQKKAWKFHKVWCKVDAVKDVNVPSASKSDVEMSVS